MSWQIFRSYLDSLMALFLVAASAAVSVSAYQAVLHIEKPKQAVMDNIPAGKHEWAIFTGEQCVGTLHTELGFEPGTVLLARGELRVKLGQHVQVIKFFAGTFFNVLDQLVTSNMSIESPTAIATVHLTNPNPIDISLEVKQGETAFSRTFSLPGPVSLKKIQTGLYRVDYSALLGMFEQYSHWLPVGSMKKDSLQVFSDQRRLSQCKATPDAAIEMDPVIEQLQQTVARIRGVFHLPGEQ